MAEDTTLESDVLDRFFFLLAKRDDFSHELIARLQRLRDERTLTSSTAILQALKQGSSGNE